MPKFEHTGLKLTLTIQDDLRQGDLEKWSAAIREFEPRGGQTSIRENRGAILRAALKAGVAHASRPGTDEIKPGDVAELDPRWVNWFGSHLSAAYLEYDAIPPE